MADKTWDSINKSVVNGGPLSETSDYDRMKNMSTKELLNEAMNPRVQGFRNGDQFRSIKGIFDKEAQENVDSLDYFLNYVGIDSDKVQTSRAYSESAKNNSIGSEKVSVDERKKVKTDSKTMDIFKKTAAFIAGIAVIGGLAAGISYGRSKIEEANLAKETVGYQSVVENTHRTEDNKGYWYDTQAIASDLASSKDYDDDVYGAYYRVNADGYNVDGTMNDIISQSSDYTDFKDYLRSQGLIKEDGTIDVNKYEAQASMSLKEHTENNTGERTR